MVLPHLSVCVPLTGVYSLGRQEGRKAVTDWGTLTPSDPVGYWRRVSRLLNERMKARSFPKALSQREAFVNFGDNNFVLSVFILSVWMAKLHFNSEIL